MRHVLICSAALIAAWCSSAFAQDTDADNRSAPLAGWLSETFELPSGFAPQLPTGVESLRFAPGWRTPDDEGFWSYAFVMWLDEVEPSAERVDELLEMYYTGLMSAFGVGRDGNQPSEGVRVELRETEQGRFEGTMRLIDGFATFEPLELLLVVGTTAEGESNSSVSIRVSPQPKTHEIWRSLEAAVASVRSSGRPQPHEEVAPAVGALSGLAKLINSRWRLGGEGGWVQMDTWSWGPGAYSIRGDTLSTLPNWDTTSGVRRVIYWHPGRKELAVLAFSRGDLLAEGVVEVGGDSVEFRFGLHSSQFEERRLVNRWVFGGRDRYTSTLLEHVGEAEPVPLASWEYVRLEDGAAEEEALVVPASAPAARLDAFEPWLGGSWETPNDASLAVRTTIERITSCEAVYVRVESLESDGGTASLLDGYVYVQPETRRFRVLALSHDGGVYEGDVREIGNGAFEAAFTGYEGDTTRQLSVRIETGPDGELRSRAWTGSGNDRTLAFDVRQARPEP